MILSASRILEKVLCFFSIFWWWLRHCYASRVPTNFAMVVNMRSILLRLRFMKWLWWIYKNQWYLLFSSTDQCPIIWFGFFYLSIGIGLIFFYLILFCFNVLLSLGLLLMDSLRPLLGLGEFKMFYLSISFSSWSS